MHNAIVTYETFHGSAKKVAEIIADKLNCKCINVDTPFEAEDLSGIDTVVLVFNFRGPYTAQLTKLYLSRVKSQLAKKNMILVGEGLFSEKEFPIVAEEIFTTTPSRTFHKFFVNGQLRVATLFPEERALLDKFSQLTGMEQLLTECTGVSCTVADDPESCVAFGCGKSLGWINTMSEGPINIAKKRIMREG